MGVLEMGFQQKEVGVPAGLCVCRDLYQTLISAPELSLLGYAKHFNFQLCAVAVRAQPALLAVISLIMRYRSSSSPSGAPSDAIISWRESTTSHVSEGHPDLGTWGITSKTSFLKLSWEGNLVLSLVLRSPLNMDWLKIVR